ncbi:DUF262 domain-containing protein [Geobacter sp. AOG2]|uniref:DUF262 domain-containing protein n=1 Tax=Geobacter sp. AOG2 TaxID=1566347 RepID=UPI001CC7F14D|nr:DUF262 domain-containing protein [Geobacter sp. AOG2]GFE62864.1 hypothetical protein AOG2_34530 [Geobacter sp. AOG2]
MSFQTPITIANAIEDVEYNRLLLPAIQREFVWSNSQIEWLFDSIMRHYPISSFLFWKVEGETKSQYKFYSFLNNYRERYQTHNAEFSTNGVNDFMAVLDGQQRLASIYIGLKGSYAYKMPRLWWNNDEYSIPTRLLYLNILTPLNDEEDGRVYDFKFLTRDEYSQDKRKWFKVGDILNLKSLFEFNKYLDENSYKDNEFSYETLSRLQESIHTDRMINYFLEKEQNIDKALNIFIRINSGGEPLNFSDLLMSIAIANWSKKDARKELNLLVDEIRDKGFFINKDLILKTFLVLYSNDIRFKVTNFSKGNAQDFEEKWDNIKCSFHSVFDLIKSFGFTETTLTSKNAIIPIIYYLYHKNIYTDFHRKKCYEADRNVIKKWLHVVLIKRTFGGQADAILSKIRNVFTDDIGIEKIKLSIQEFPHDLIVKELRGTTKDMTFDEDYIDKLLQIQKDDSLCFSILAVLYPHLDYRNGDFHKDHIFPESMFMKRKLTKLGIGDVDFEFYLDRNNYNGIANLQLLDSNENMSKQDIDLKTWVLGESKKKNLTQKEFCVRHLIPELLEVSQFKEFIYARKELLKGLLLQLA